MRVRCLGWEDPLEWEWQTTVVFLPAESQGQRSHEGYSPKSHKELNMTEHLSRVSQLNNSQDFSECWNIVQSLEIMSV